MPRFERGVPGSTPGRGSRQSRRPAAAHPHDMGKIGGSNPPGTNWKGLRTKDEGQRTRLFCLLYLVLSPFRTGVCSWESRWPPKSPYRVRILALLLADVARTAQAPAS